MAKRTTGVNKSAEIRKLLEANPDLPVNEVLSTMAGQGLKVTANLVYFIKGKMKGRKGRRRKARQMVAKVAATGNGDPIATILKVKHCAAELGGMKKLKALIEALGSE